jgi:hypothetical protein
VEALAQACTVSGGGALPLAVDSTFTKIAPCIVANSFLLQFKHTLYILHSSGVHKTCATIRTAWLAIKQFLRITIIMSQTSILTLHDPR